MMAQKDAGEGAFFKTADSLTICETEACKVEVGKGALAVPIELQGRQRGYMFHGKSRLLVDTIVETEGGAIGKPIEKNVNEPFLMFREDDNLRKELVEASDEDLHRYRYKNRQDLFAKVEELLYKFDGRRTLGSNHFCGVDSLVFGFQNEKSEFDLLVVNDSKMVYKTRDIVFVSDKHRKVLKSPENVVVSNAGKMSIVRNHTHRDYICH